MRLHSIEVENWRNHTRKRVDFDEKSTIIYGPNESGKSNILEALFRGFFDRSKSSAGPIKRITPLSAVGNLASKVVITFSLQGQKYSIEKTFNHNRGSELCRIDNEIKTPIVHDADADRRLIEMIEADISTGVSDPSKWGAFYWLWTPQENRRLPEKGDTTSYLHLDQKGETALVTPVYQNVHSSIATKFLEYFTKKGNVTKKSPVSILDGEIDKQKFHVLGLKQKYNQVLAYQTEINEIKEEISSINLQTDETKNDLKAARGEINELSSFETELDSVQMEIRDTKRNISDAESAIEQLTKVSTQIQELQEQENTAISARSQLEVLCGILQAKLDELDRIIIQQQSKVSKIEDLTKDARSQYSIIRYNKDITELNEKVEKITKIEEEIQTLRAKIKTVIVSKEELEKLTANSIQIDLLNQGLTDVGLQVKILPGNKGTLNVDVDGKQIIPTTTGTTGTREVVVYSENLGKVTINADIEKAKKIKKEIEEITKEIAEAISRDSVSSINELKELFNDQDRIKREIESLNRQRDYVDARSLEELELEVTDITGKISVYKKEARSEYSIRLNPLNDKLGALITQRELERDKAVHELDEMQKDRESKRQELEDKRGDEIIARAKAQNLQEKRMESIKDERGLMDKFGNLNSQKTVQDEQGIILATQKGKEARILDKMKELDGPLTRVRDLETKLENEEKLLSQKTSRTDYLLGSIETESLQGVYSGISEGESKLEALEDRYTRLAREAYSLHLLLTMLEEDYQNALDSISEPIKEDVAEFLAYITGNLHEEVELNDKLIPTRMGQRGIDELALEFEDGSSGLKEALTLCVRLAVAKHLCAHDSQSLVLDDPFIHMSKNRSERMIDIFNNLVRENGLQIIILTHRELEFTGLEGEMINIQQ